MNKFPALLINFDDTSYDDIIMINNILPSIYLLYNVRAGLENNKLIDNIIH